MKPNRTQSELIQLHIISPAFVEPPPNKASGRFASVLRDVGGQKSVYVRPRMITAVAGTKYKTLSGLPVTLVGLHGKDELLVVGPDWAILRLANGERPPKSTKKSVGLYFDRAIQFVLEEIFWLHKLQSLVVIAKSDGSNLAIFADASTFESLEVDLNAVYGSSAWKSMSESVSAYNQKGEKDKEIAEEMLQGMFARPYSACIHHFNSIDISEFSEMMIKDCLCKYLEFQDMSEKLYDIHTNWWSEWDVNDENTEAELKLNYLATSGRNISRYDFGDELMFDPSELRRYSMHQRWTNLIDKHKSN